MLCSVQDVFAQYRVQTASARAGSCKEHEGREIPAGIKQLHAGATVGRTGAQNHALFQAGMRYRQNRPGTVRYKKTGYRHGDRKEKQEEYYNDQHPKCENWYCGSEP